MNTWLYLIPFLSALIGFVLNWLGVQFFFKKILREKRLTMATRIGSMASSGFFSFADIEQKISEGDGIKKLMPTIEQHIDEFLRHKLGKAMPVISMFIGDKTINQLKGVFMKELEEILPATIKSYMGNLQEDLDIGKIVTEKITAIPPERLEAMIREAIPAELRIFMVFGAVCGFIIGLIELGFILLVGS